MDNKKKLIVILIVVSLLTPLTTLYLSLVTGLFSLKIIFLLIMMFTMMPIMAMGAYMWITGKGHWAIKGYNTMSKSQQVYYDADKMARDTGKITTIGCAACLLGVCALLYMQDGVLIFIGVVAIVVFVTVFYYGTGRKYLKDPTKTTPQINDYHRMTKAAMWVGIGVTAVILVAIGIFIASGNVNATMEDERLHVDAPMVDKNIFYVNIKSVELREDFDIGSRTGGFSGTNVLSGNFNNYEFGDYTLACYKNVRAHIVVESKHEGVVVFNQKTVGETVNLYNQLLEKLIRE